MTHPTTAQQEDLQNLPQQENLQNNYHLIVANYPCENTAKQLKALFSRLGEVSDAHLNRHEGTGFVSYVDPQVALRAVFKFNNKAVDRNWSPYLNQMVVISTARSLNVRLTDEYMRRNAPPPHRRDEQRNIPHLKQVVPQQIQQQEMQQQFKRNAGNHHLFTLYFNNVPYEITYQHLARFFSKLGGPISKLHLVHDHWYGRHKGLGWVTFLDRRSRDDCYYNLRNSTERILGRKIYVNHAKPLRAARI